MKPFLLLAFQLFSISAFSVIIPAARRITWQDAAGIPGGIPNGQTRFCNITKSIPGSGLVAFGDGAHNDGPAIAAAISLCPSNQFIYFPPGIYTNNTAFTMRDGVVLRGAGMDSTKIIGGTFDFTSSYSFKHVNLFGSSTVIAKGATTMIVQTNALPESETGSLLPTVGSIIQIGVTNDNQVIDPVGVEGSWANVFSSFPDKNMGQMAEVTAISASSVSNRLITFSPPSVWNYSNSLGVVVRFYSSLCYRSGIEDMTLETPPPNTQGNVVLLNGAAFCWLKNVKVSWSYLNAVEIRKAFRCEFRRCWLKNTQHGNTAGGYGFEFDLLPSFNLIEDNIVEGLRASIFVEGGSGNVIGYNYVPWATNNSGVLQKHLAFHASSPAFNLFEGNKAPSAGGDNTHGSSIYNTYFRNYLTGTNTVGNTTGGSTSYNWAIKQDRKARYYNWVGNVIGVPGLTGVYETSSVTSPNTRNTALRYIWTLGYVSDGHTDTNDFSGFAYDRNIRTDLLRQVNYDYVSGANVVNNANVQDANDGIIPSSLYLASKPAWFGHFVWPPIGPDIASLTNTIPAEARYFGLICQ